MDEQLMQQIVTALKPFFNEINAEFAKVRSEMHAGFARINGELAKAETNAAETKSAVRRIAIDVSQLKDRMTTVEETMATKAAMTARFDLVEARFDVILPVFLTARSAQTMADKSHAETLASLKNHEDRLKLLENKPS
jgi:hypothetical protein